MAAQIRFRLGHQFSAVGCRAMALLVAVLTCLAPSGFSHAQRDGGGDGRPTILSKSTLVRSMAIDGEILTEDGWTLRAGCRSDCGTVHVLGEQVLLPVVASPVGTTYSVHHWLGADLDGAGPDGVTCFPIFDPGAPGDDIVNYDGIAETLRPDIFGTVATVNELHEVQQDGTRYLQINTTSPMGTQLFPGGEMHEGQPLTDACFAIGLDDPLDWQGLDTVNLAVIRFFQDDLTLVGPVDITALFSNPWNGVLNVTLPGGAGLGINGVRLEIILEKQVGLPNDSCDNAIDVTNGTLAFSNIGATTDGLEHPGQCLFFGYSDIGSDVWFRYTSTCTGNLTVNLCNSSFDTKVAVYGNCGRCPIESNPIACNDDFCSQQSYIPAVPVVQGNCYMIRVGGYQGAQGQGVLSLSCDAPSESGACCVGGECVGTTSQSNCVGQMGDWFEDESCDAFLCPGATPDNDLCENAIRLFTGVPYVGSTTGATGTDVSSCTLNDSNDVWHFWTADCTGLVDVETCSSFSLDTSLAAYDACGGFELACNDDACSTRSRITELPVVLGTTYFFRVAGWNFTTGPYQIHVNPCRSACCSSMIPTNFGCTNIIPQQCLAGGGVPQLPGTLCLGDINENGTNDVCEGCPQNARIVGADPPSGTIDARQPHSAMTAQPRQGIGSPGGVGTLAEPIRVQMIPQFADLENCFSLCETAPDPVKGGNFISSVTFIGSGRYQILLDRAITAGEVTTIQYLGDLSFAQFTAHPGNVNADPATNLTDVIRLVDCCLGGLCSVPYGMRSCDLDRSTIVGPLDLLTAMNMLNGAEAYEEWLNTPRPTNSSCPP